MPCWRVHVHVCLNHNSKYNFITYNGLTKMTIGLIDENLGVYGIRILTVINMEWPLLYLMLYTCTRCCPLIYPQWNAFMIELNNTCWSLWHPRHYSVVLSVISYHTLPYSHQHRQYTDEYMSTRQCEVRVLHILYCTVWYIVITELFCNWQSRTCFMEIS